MSTASKPVAYILKFYHQTTGESSYLKGPRSPKEVRKHGYAFTPHLAEAWSFPTQAQARNKERIVYLHMGMGDAVAGKFHHLGEVLTVSDAGTAACKLCEAPEQA